MSFKYIYICLFVCISGRNYPRIFFKFFFIFWTHHDYLLTHH